MGVVKPGVPLFIDDKELCADLVAGGFGKTTVKRINKGNKTTRAVKVYFENHEILTKAINDRVSSQNITFTVDRFNHSAVIRCYNCQENPKRKSTKTYAAIWMLVKGFQIHTISIGCVYYHPPSDIDQTNLEYIENTHNQLMTERPDTGSLNTDTHKNPSQTIFCTIQTQHALSHC